MRKQKYRIGIIFLVLLLSLSLNAFALEGEDVVLDRNSVNNDVSELETADNSYEVLPVDASAEEPVEDDSEEEIALESIESTDDVLMAGGTNEQSVQVSCENSITLEQREDLKVNSVGTIFFTDITISDESAVYISSQTSTSFYIHGSEVGSATITVTGDNNTTTTIVVTVIPRQIKLYDFYEYDMDLYWSKEFTEQTDIGIASVTSSDESVVKPYDVLKHSTETYRNGNFKLAAVGKGTATVTVTGINGTTCSHIVTVKDPRYLDCPESIVVKLGPFSIETSEKVGTVESSDPSVIKFVQAGYDGKVKFEALNEGNATISVHYPFIFGEKIIKTEVTVKTPDITYSRSPDITVQEGSDPVRVLVEEDVTSYYQPIKDYQYISNVIITGDACVTVNYWGFMFDIEPVSAGKARVTIVEKTGREKVFNVTVTAKPAAPPVVKDREIRSISTIYRNTTKVKLNVRNVKAGDVLKLKIGKKKYKKKIKSDSDNCTIIIKIKKPKKYGQYVDAWLETNKGTFYYDDQEDEAYVYYGKKIKKGLTKKQVKWTSTWGSPSDTASASGGRTYWFYDDGSAILFKKGKVKKWYDAGGF